MGRAYGETAGPESCNSKPHSQFGVGGLPSLLHGRLWTEKDDFKWWCWAQRCDACLQSRWWLWRLGRKGFEFKTILGYIETSSWGGGRKTGLGAGTGERACLCFYIIDLISSSTEGCGHSGASLRCTTDNCNMRFYGLFTTSSCGIMSSWIQILKVTAG